jgi:putative Holliday junction resolvase
VAPVLALDVGDRRIGVALSDPLQITVRPLTTLENRPDAPGRIGALVEEWDVERLVVGYPRLPSGDRGDQARAVEAFVERLARCVAVPIEFWDESFTTLAAEERLRRAGVGVRRQKARIDAEAAAVILEEWLMEHRPPPPPPGAA